MRGIAWTLGPALCLLVLVLWLLNESRGQGGHGTSAATRPSETPAAEPVGPGESELSRGDLAAADRAAIQVEPTVEAGAPEEQRAPPAGLAGRLTILDELGAVHTSESARITLYARGGERTGWLYVDVVDGKFSLAPPANSRIEVRSIALLGERFGPARLARSERELIPALWEGELELRAQLIPHASLHVVGADAGQDLTGVEVLVLREGAAWHSHLLPEDDDSMEQVCEDAISPIALPTAPAMRRYWARAHGYAWGIVNFDHARGGTQTLELQPESSLTVTLTGAPPPDGATIRLRDPRGGGLVETARHGKILVETAPATDGPTRMEGLPPDRYQVSLEVDGSGRALQWGRTVASTTAHGETFVTLDLREPGDPSVPLRGVLVLPEGTERDSVRLEVRAHAPGRHVATLQAADMEPVPGEERTFTWDAGGVLPGVHVFWLRPSYHREAVQVGPEGAHVRIELPPSVRALLRVRDSQTLQPVEGADVSWKAAALEVLGHTDSVSEFSVGLDTSTGLFAFTAPAGKVRVEASAEGYVGREAEVEVAAGGGVIDFDLDLLTAVRLVYRDAESGETLSPMKCPAPGFERGSPAEAVTIERSWSNSSARTFSLPIGDEYTLRFPEKEGFEPVGPLTVVVGHGETVEVTVTVSHSDDG